MDVLGTIIRCDDLTSPVILRVVPVYVKGATVVYTFALCDKTSTTTLIDETIADQVGVVGSVVPFCCKCMNKMSKKYEPSRKVKFET
jgi:hypothetical protein